VLCVCVRVLLSLGDEEQVLDEAVVRERVVLHPATAGPLRRTRRAQPLHASHRRRTRPPASTPSLSLSFILSFGLHFRSLV